MKIQIKSTLEELPYHRLPNFRVFIFKDDDNPILFKKLSASQYVNILTAQIHTISDEFMMTHPIFKITV